MHNIAVSGAQGKMGKLIMDVLVERDDTSLAQAIEYSEHPLQGQAVLANTVLTNQFTTGDVLIDFSTPAGLMTRVAECVARKKGIVVGTTGSNDEQLATIEAAAKEIPVLVTSNTSLGVNVVFRMAAEIARALGEDFDIEIIEKHHRFKKDAPSGTALSIAESICDATGRSMRADLQHGREGAEAERQKGEIGMHAVRCGDIVGEHTAIFCSLGERIELVSRVHTRETFARGAVRCAQFLAEQKPGMYGMKDVLGF